MLTKQIALRECVGRWLGFEKSLSKQASPNGHWPIVIIIIMIGEASVNHASLK